MGASWITAEEAQSRLGVKLQTLYAYASRGLVSTSSDAEDPRRSLYAAEDIMRLALRKSRGRQPAAPTEPVLSWAEPAVTSTVAMVTDGRLFYRGRDVFDLAETATLEETSRLLWQAGDEDPFTGLAPHPLMAVGPDPRARAFSLLAFRAAHDPAASGRTEAALRREAASVLTDFVDAICGQARNGPLHDRLAKAWRVEGLKAEMIRRALVVAADQELNPASLAVRVAASTGAPLAASALAGLATFAGPLHGGMTAQVSGFMAEARRTSDPRAAAMHRLAQGLDVPGFGHALYPAGDPRAKAISAGLTYADDIAGIAAAGEAVTGLAPNLDFALVAMARTLGLPGEAPFVIMMVARTAGWLAHAIEQRTVGAQLRPKTRYAAAEGDADADDAAHAA
jgi:citrate synthase